MTNPTAANVGETIEFHYQKTPSYRVLHVDGMWGGATPKGHFSVSFFSERLAIPRVSQRTVTASTSNQYQTGPEQPVDMLDGVVRQVDATVIMDLRTAQEFYVFMTEHLGALETTLGIPEADRVVKNP